MRSRAYETALAAIVAGTVATLTVTAALGLAARQRRKSVIQPINATSHWLAGPKAGGKRGLDMRHTGVGFLTNHAASIFWALPLQLSLSRKAPASEVATEAALISGIAALVDYGLFPQATDPWVGVHVGEGRSCNRFPCARAWPCWLYDLAAHSRNG